jgi:predicted lysophospholipase L1 biosynthesis ABC-type transport system permease subunit
MDNKTNNIEDLKHIRNLMERSSKFLTLSGFSGIAAGIIALAGAAVAWFCIFRQGAVKYDEYMRVLGGGSTIDLRLQMAVLAALTLVCAVGAAWYFSLRKAKRTGTKLWTSVARRTLYHFLIPLCAGGVFCIALVIHNNINLIGSAMLIFYGLALVNSAKFTIDELHFLGLSEIALGILAGFFLNYGLLFWAIGFGVLHIIYGIHMHYKYDRK